MADSSLDDFFAKKDKNKRTKKKNITTDEIAKKLEESAKRAEKLRKSKDKSIAGALNTNMSEQEDEEWNDFEEEREKDYSGLRIQALSIRDKEEELREQQLQDIEEDKQREGVSGPWKKSANPDADSETDKNNEEVTTHESTAVVTSAQTGSQPSKYVPPHLRNQPQTGSGNTGLNPIALSGTRKSKSGAPKIADIVEFPTLGAIDSNEDIKGFQTVKYGSHRDTIERNSPNVTLDNKYSLLTNNSSKELQNNCD